MAEVTRAAKVGIMTVALTGAAYTAYRFIAPAGSAGDGYRVWAHLPDVMGVAPHSRVMISGIQVGTVAGIWLDNGKARVDIQMRPDIALKKDAAISKQASSLIGESYIVLVPGIDAERVGCFSNPENCGAEGQITRFIEEPNIQTLQGQIHDILVDVKAVTETLKQTVGSDTGQGQIAAILQNLAQTTEELNLAVKENREGIRQSIDNVNLITADARPQIEAILRNVNTITSDVRALTGRNDQGEAGEVRSAVQRIDRASESLENMMEHAEAVAARIDRGEGTVGRLTKDEKLIDEVEGVVEDVGELVGGLGRLQTIVGLRTDYNFLANTIKSYVEVRLQPTEDKYYAIELVNDPRGRTSFEQVDVDTTNPNDPPHYRETRSVTTNAFRFSFQFAKRMGPFTGRFGIRESTGGIGLDLHLLDDRFELRQDLFGFGEELNPRWRVALSYEFIRKLWLMGGVDDIFNDERRDYFVGLQLRFNDEDLKSVLPFAPSAL